MRLLRLNLARLQSVVVPVIAWLFLLAVLAWVAAGWFWRIAAPAANMGVFAPIADPMNAANEIASRHLFGVNTSSGTDNQPAVALSSSLKIIGVLTGNSLSPGFAVVQEDGKNTRPVIEGEDIVPGIRLLKVLAQGVEIQRDGQKDRLMLSTNQTGVPPAPMLLGNTPAMQTPAIQPMQQPAVPPAAAIVPPPARGPNGDNETKPAEQSSD